MTDPQESWQQGQPLALIEGAHACFEREAVFQHGDVHPTKKQVANALAKDQLWYGQDPDSGRLVAAAEFIELLNGSKHKLFAGRELTIAPGSIVVKRFGCLRPEAEDMKTFFGLVKNFVEWLCSEGDPAELWFEIFEEDLAMKAIARRMGLKYYGSKVVGQGQIRGLYAVADLAADDLPVHERVGLKVLYEDFIDPEEAKAILLAVLPNDGAPQPGAMDGPLARIGARLGMLKFTREMAQPWLNFIPAKFQGPRTVFPAEEGKLQLRIPLKADPDKQHAACWSLRGSIWKLPLRERQLYFLDQRKPHAYFNSGQEDSDGAAELVFDVPANEETRIKLLVGEEADE